MASKTKILLVALIASLVMLSACSMRSEVTADYVVLIHGLWNSSSRMADFETYFAAKGYQVLNLSYPST